jgi:hypothetical protein
MGKFHNVLYIALKVAWNWNIKDSAAICELLGEGNSIVGCFNREFHCFVAFCWRKLKRKEKISLQKWSRHDCLAVWQGLFALKSSNFLTNFPRKTETSR